ncbi:PQQ-dependent sugar dehydrogenase [Haloarchaeobius sp. HRN-SO-5]|uniref:PQQ-dependent sugar dehydrogenase n=1 Tax=Haloarchaeobius sp. HRN-SO-5 TaxID=3446118 RepID=UPI003EBEF2DA
MHRRRFLAAVGTAALGTTAGCILDPTDDRPTETDEDRRPIRLERIRMRLETPWGASFHPETGVLYVTERGGRIQRVTGSDAGLVRDLTDGTAARGEGGLLGVTFDAVDPDWAYVYQTYEGVDGLRNRILRLDVTDEFAVESVLVDGIPAGEVNNGGRVAFGPDGALWVTTGDAGVPDRAQDTDALAGKVLRLTREGTAHPDNPFDNPVFTYGHRNPQGISFVDGEAYVVERGLDNPDEFNRLRRGGNYGWPAVMGESDDGRFVQPLVSWQTAVGPAGLAHYTGPISRWQGSFFVSTLRGGHLRRVRFGDDGTAEETELFDDLGRIRTTFTGPEDHLYFTTSNQEGPGEPDPTDDEIYRVRPP